MTLTDALALWGGITGTIAIVWEIFTWLNNGPRIVLNVRENMRISGDENLEGKKLITIQATNIGDRPTTLQKLGFTYYANWWSLVLLSWLFGPPVHYLIKNPGLDPGRKLPLRLDVGDVWDAFTFQTSEMDKMLAGGVVYAFLYASHRRNPIRVRIKVTKSTAVDLPD